MKSVFLVSSLAVACDAANIVELAQATPQLSTLVAAVIAADLVETLSSPGTFTVFAPTNDAFGALPAGVLDDLLKPANKAALSDVLTYHVLSQELKYTDDSGKRGVNGVFDTVLGKPLFISAGGVGAPFAAQSIAFRGANILADNGVVHIIEGVMLPSLVETGRTFNIESYNNGHSRLPGGNCQEKYLKERVVAQEGECYHRDFNTTAGDGETTGNDQRAFCRYRTRPAIVDGKRVEEVYKTTLVSLQYSSTDGSCSDPRTVGSSGMESIQQGANDFNSGTCNTVFGSNGPLLLFACPGPPGSEESAVLV